MYKDIGEKSNRIIRIKECEPCEKNIARKPGGYERKLQLKTSQASKASSRSIYAKWHREIFCICCRYQK